MLPQLVDNIRRQRNILLSRDEEEQNVTEARNSVRSERRNGVLQSRSASILVNNQSLHDKKSRASTIASALVYGIKDEQEILTMNINGANYGYKKISTNISNRKNNWITRYADSLDETMIKKEARNMYEQAAIDILKSNKNIVKLPPYPDEINHITKDDLLLFNNNILRSNNCFECGEFVSYGAERIVCKSCPMICHLRCITNINDFIINNNNNNESRVCTPLNTEYNNNSVSFDATSMITYTDISIRNKSDKLKKQINKDPSTKNQFRKEIAHAFLRSTSELSLPDIISRASSSDNIPSRPNSVITGLEHLHTEDPYWRLTNKNVNWICQFCSNDISEENIVRDLKYQYYVNKYNRLKSTIKLQSIIRMLLCKVKYNKARNGIILLQRAIRVREMARLDELERANERHPFRIRIHDITLLIKDTELYNKDLLHLHYNSSIRDSDNSSSKKVGTPGNLGRKNSYFASKEQIIKKFKDFPVLPSPNVIGEMTTMAYDKFFGEFKVAGQEPEEKDLPMIELLSNGHQDSPTFAKTFRSMQHVNAGTVFLVVTIHEKFVTDPRAKQSEQAMASRRPLQICRYDLPLKCVNNKQHNVTMHLLMKLGYSDHLENNELEYIASRYKYTNYILPKSYLLIPYSRANAEVKMTLCCVTEWPKAVVIGQSVMNLKYYISRKRAISLIQSVCPIGYSDIPATEDGVKMNMVLPRPSAADEEEAMEMQRAQSRRGKSRENTKAKPRRLLHESKVEKSELALAKRVAEEVEYSGGMVTWTLLPMGFSEMNDRGFMMQLNQEVITSTKKKVWCILLDKIMTVFSIVQSAIKVKHVLDVRSTYVTLCSDDVIKMKTPSETLFFLPLSPKEHETWFRKLYTQGLSQTVQPYHLYIRKKGNNRIYRQESFNTDLGTLLEGNLARGGKRNSIITKAKTNKNRNSMTRSSFEEVELLDNQLQAFLDELHQEYYVKAANELTDFLTVKQPPKTTGQLLDTLTGAFTTNLHRF